jgi:hypothetical protein
MYIDIAHSIIHETFQKTIAQMQIALEQWILKAGGRDGLDTGQKKHVEGREHTLTVLYQYEQSAERLLDVQLAELRRENANLKAQLQQPTVHLNRVMTIGEALEMKRAANMMNTHPGILAAKGRIERENKETTRQNSILKLQAEMPDLF